MERSYSYCGACSERGLFMGTWLSARAAVLGLVAGGLPDLLFLHLELDAKRLHRGQQRCKEGQRPFVLF